MPPTHLSAIHPSPKRKREHPPHAPLANTTLRHASTPPRGSPTPSGADSPRNVVADQLRGMSIAAMPALLMLPLSPTDDVMRKKPRLDAMRMDSVDSEDLTDLDITSPGKSMAQSTIARKPRQLDGAKEIPETPHSQQPRIFPDIAATAQPTVFASSTSEGMGRQPKSSPQSSNSQNGTAKPRPRKKSPSPPLQSLTWQDSEITGHLIDPATDPDDDGTGINGIGFKPTPALAYARTQKRRQQVLDWKAREAREARAKRSERRRRGVGGAGLSSREGTVERDVTAKEADAARRAVRFAI